MDEMTKLVEEIEANINAFLVDAKKTTAPKSAWLRARKMSLVLAKQFKQFRAVSVEAAKNLKGKE